MTTITIPVIVIIVMMMKVFESKPGFFFHISYNYQLLYSKWNKYSSFFKNETPFNRSQNCNAF